MTTYFDAEDLLAAPTERATFNVMMFKL